VHFADLLSKIHATWCTGAHMTSLKLYREEHYNFSEIIAWANQNIRKCSVARHGLFPDASEFR